MALDRFVRFPKGEEPTYEALAAVIADYLGGTGTVRWMSDQSRWYIYLPGRNTKALRSVNDLVRAVDVSQDERMKRWIEVFHLTGDDAQTDVMTRQHDEFTNAVARGLAYVIAHAFGGEVEDE
jgi:hypothetical protein